MKTRSYSSTLITTLFAAAIAVPVLAQERSQVADGVTGKEGAAGQHHHYKLIDVGTFGGPTSSVNEVAQVVRSNGTLVGGADTTTPDPNFPNSCLFCLPDPFITHAFQWQHGVLTDLGALSGTNSSFAQWTSNSGLTAGYSEDGTIDPLLGIPAVHAVLWREGHIEDLGTLEGGYESGAFSINSRGQVTGVSGKSVAQQRVFLWEKGKMKDLGTLGGTSAGLLGIDGNVEMNERGHIVACSETSTVNPATGLPVVEPFLWEPDTMIGLGSLGGTSGCAIFFQRQRSGGRLFEPGRGHVVPPLYLATRPAPYGPRYSGRTYRHRILDQ
jgi:probable HAF family extracellular repeat protein